MVTGITRSSSCNWPVAAMPGDSNSSAQSVPEKVADELANHMAGMELKSEAKADAYIAEVRKLKTPCCEVYDGSSPEGLETLLAQTKLYLPPMPSLVSTATAQRRRIQEANAVFVAKHLKGAALQLYLGLDTAGNAPTYDDLVKRLKDDAYGIGGPSSYYNRKLNTLQQRTTVKLYNQAFNAVVRHLSLSPQERYTRYILGLKEGVRLTVEMRFMTEEEQEKIEAVQQVAQKHDEVYGDPLVRNRYAPMRSDRPCDPNPQPPYVPPPARQHQQYGWANQEQCNKCKGYGHWARDCPFQRRDGKGNMPTNGRA